MCANPTPIPFFTSCRLSVYPPVHMSVTLQAKKATDQPIILWLLMSTLLLRAHQARYCHSIIYLSLRHQPKKESFSEEDTVRFLLIYHYYQHSTLVLYGSITGDLFAELLFFFRIYHAAASCDDKSSIEWKWFAKKQIVNPAIRQLMVRQNNCHRLRFCSSVSLSCGLTRTNSRPPAHKAIKHKS